MRVRRYLEKCKATGGQRVRTRVSEITNKERIYPTRRVIASTQTLFTIEEIESYNVGWGGGAETSDQQRLGRSA